MHLLKSKTLSACLKTVWDVARRETCDRGSVKSVPPLVVDGLKVECPAQVLNHHVSNIPPRGHSLPAQGSTFPV